ncbi:hypothetical protein [Gluconacetobacter diazotrophicus]|uniref:Putative membrane protein n=1 Tax=Gluconacetobacter diazotrophicus (strain ATCC 49037 / DSM 5601 / CCUG 37298 / CIP 103539 / LMG 7603 / PAl5) TaxID=272568 RepID=A9HSW7_GLUDA|nr:hypothetical protein [Gluconacetobacter diazotrophicus]CAP57838.1 putative membrane protein [Gluconacetobacter diazotrophicus PA1 5]
MSTKAIFYTILAVLMAGVGITFLRDMIPVGAPEPQASVLYFTAPICAIGAIAVAAMAALNFTNRNKRPE